MKASTRRPSIVPAVQTTALFIMSLSIVAARQVQCIVESVLWLYRKLYRNCCHQSHPVLYTESRGCEISGRPSSYKALSESLSEVMPFAPCNDVQ